MSKRISNKKIKQAIISEISKYPKSHLIGAPEFKTGPCGSASLARGNGKAVVYGRKISVWQK